MKKLKHPELFTHSIIDSLPIALLITDENNEALLFNNTFIQLWQIPTEIQKKISSNKIFSFLDSKLEDSSFFKNTLNHLIKNPYEAKFDELQHKNGSTIECYTLPRWANNVNSGRVWNFRDVSQQKRAEQLLIKQKEELNNAHRIAQLGSWVYNIESKEFKWSESITGICEGLLVQKNIESFLSVIHPDDKEKVKNFFEQLEAKQGNKEKELKYRVINKKGDIYYLRTIPGIESITKKTIRVSGITQDITQESLLEKSLASAKEAAEDYNVAKDNIFSSISHEMRTPLNAILGYTRILLQNSNDKFQEDYIKSIQTSGESLLTLIEDILYISKVDKDEVEINEDNVNLRNLANDIHQIFKLKFKRKRIDFSIDVSKEIPEGIVIDKTRLKQILVNLISNGLKFTEKGSVSVKFDGKAIPYSNLFDLTIYIEDTGIGIDEKDQKKIFDSFAQIDNSAKRDHQGAGLGLYITKRNIELLGGNIKVHSALKKGSLFVINLKSLKTSLFPEKYSGERFHKIKTLRFEEASILVADDHEFNREILRYLLSQFNFEIFEGENGKDAVLLAEKFKPSLIIMDLKMPELNGYEALKILHKNPETMNIPVIAFSSQKTGVNKGDLLKAGFVDFLSKPVTFSKTIKVLRQFLNYKQIDTENQYNLNSDLKKFLKNIEAITLLKTCLLDSWKKLHQKKTIKEQLEFAIKLSEFGIENELEFIKALGESLKKSLQLYDIDKSENILLELEQLFKETN